MHNNQLTSSWWCPTHERWSPQLTHCVWNDINRCRHFIFPNANMSETICHCERFTCKFFHCMPHRDLACRTECSNHDIFNCQFSVMVCHTLTLPVLLSAANWLPMKNRLLMTTYIWNLPARGKTLLFREVARRFHLTQSTNLNKTVVYGPAKWRYLIHIKVPRSECISLFDWTKKFNSNLL